MTTRLAKLLDQRLTELGLSNYAIDQRTGINSGQMSKYRRGEERLPRAHLPKLAALMKWAPGSAEYAEFIAALDEEELNGTKRLADPVSNLTERTKAAERLALRVFDLGLKRGLKFPRELIEEAEALRQRVDSPDV
jgi:hypothetical protein